MAWTAPMTAVSGAVYTAAQFNTFVRDNLVETCPAKASVMGSYFVTTATNQIGERVASQATVGTSDTTSNTSWGDLDNTSGPLVTCTTGSTALVVVGARIGPNSSGTSSAKMSWAVSGASSISAAHDWAAGINGLGGSGAVYTSRAFLATGLTPGSNTFTAQYSVASGTGTFQYRSLLVMPF